MNLDASTRRTFLKVSGGSLLGAGLASIPLHTAEMASDVPPLAELERPFLTSSESLSKLMAGNLRYQKNKLMRPDQTPGRRKDTANSQNPFATIFSCIDSRVPPEIIFDQGLGDLFVIRTGAHVIDKAALGSIEYGVAELKIPLLLVLGHERCGAVKATIAAVDSSETAPGSIQFLVDYIRPSVLAATGTGAARLDDAVRINTRRTVQILLRESTILKNAVDAKKLEIHAARYDLDTGVVSLI